MSLLRCVRAAALVSGVSLGPCIGAGANDFTINLKLQAGGHEQTSVSAQPAAARPVFAAQVEEVISVQWTAVNGAASTPLSDITMHVFVDRGDARAESPKPGAKALFESALLQDFEPGGKSSGEFRLPMPERGTYFVRVETIGAAKKLGKEVAAAMQVSVP